MQVIDRRTLAARLRVWGDLDSSKLISMIFKMHKCRSFGEGICRFQLRAYSEYLFPDLTVCATRIAIRCQNVMSVRFHVSAPLRMLAHDICSPNVSVRSSSIQSANPSVMPFQLGGKLCSSTFLLCVVILACAISLCRPTTPTSRATTTITTTTSPTSGRWLI